MYEFSLKFIRCVNCNSKLELEILKQQREIEEGFLLCQNCKAKYPIIQKIPILWNSFSAYLSTRTKLGGELFLKSQSKKMKSFIKKSLSQIHKNTEDRSLIEKRWARIYQNSINSKFYSIIRKNLDDIPKQNLVLEHGCSIGHISQHLSKKHEIVFGIDRSFSAISIAKKIKNKNLDFFVADSLDHPFGHQKFGLIVGLNLLEIIEPLNLLKVLSKQLKKGTILLSDPYDYERATYSVKNQLDSIQIRKTLQKIGFNIFPKTKKSSFIPWNLVINPRAQLHYNVDLITARR